MTQTISFLQSSLLNSSDFNYHAFDPILGSLSRTLLSHNEKVSHLRRSTCLTFATGAACKPPRELPAPPGAPGVHRPPFSSSVGRETVLRHRAFTWRVLNDEGQTLMSSAALPPPVYESTTAYQ